MKILEMYNHKSLKLNEIQVGVFVIIRERERERERVSDKPAQWRSTRILVP